MALARINLSYASVTAPISGRAGQQQVTEGALVGQGEATLLATVEQVDPVYVNFSQAVGELDLLKRAVASGAVELSAPNKAKIELMRPDGTSFGAPGTLDFSDTAVDAATGAVNLRGIVPNSERNLTAMKTAMYVFGILVVFMFFGRFVLNFFGISLPVLKIAGGLIVAHTAWGMVTASGRMTPAETDEAAGKADISLTPMAMPILSGPGSIGVVMGLAATANGMTTYLGIVIGIAALALSVFLFLRLGGPLVAKLGPGAVAGITRIFGFLIFAVAVQLVWDGIADFSR